MNIVTPKFQEEIEWLLHDLKPEDCQDTEEFRLANEFHALPLGFDLWGYVFLTPSGEIVVTNWEPDGVLRLKSTQQLINRLVGSAARYPSLAAFIPAKPDDAIVCPACHGTKLWGRIVGTNEPGRCVFCAGLGWTIPDA